MGRHKQHLSARRCNDGATACGTTVVPQRTTQDPALVDCSLCIRTVAMADAEARVQIESRSGRRGRRRPRKAGRL